MKHRHPASEPPALEGTIALVTGASRRLGRAIAERLADAGADVVVHYRSDEDGAKATVAVIEAKGRRAAMIQADLAVKNACLHLADAAEAALGPIGLLVNNAAIFERTPLEELEPSDFDAHMAANAAPVHALSLHLGRRMKARGAGAIVNLADVAGMRPWVGYVPYSASKAAVISLTQGFAKLLAPEVRVNAVAPGPMLPPASASAAQGEKAVSSTLLRRWGRPSDVADAVFYLATAPYVTGVVLPVDGGRHVV